jgi:hypothetical protein
MYAIGWGAETGAFAHQRATAREALELAEAVSAANRANLSIIDLTTKQMLSLEELRERAEEEIDEEEAAKF